MAAIGLMGHKVKTLCSVPTMAVLGIKAQQSVSPYKLYQYTI